MMVREVKYQPHSTDGATETHPAVQRACNLACTAAAIGAVLSPAIWVLGHHAYAGPRWYFDSAVGLAVVVAVTRWHWQRRPAPEPEWDHERELLAWAQSDWQMICEAGGLRPPLVKRIWRTETGWGYYLVITRMADHEGKPISTTQFAEWGGYIRDLVGVGCHGVHIEPDPANGGRVVAYINYKPKPVPYRVAVTIGHEERICTTPEQTERARAEAAAWEESERKRLARAGEGARGDLLTENQGDCGDVGSASVPAMGERFTRGGSLSRSAAARSHRLPTLVVPFSSRRTRARVSDWRERDRSPLGSSIRSPICSPIRSPIRPPIRSSIRPPFAPSGVRLEPAMDRSISVSASSTVKPSIRVTRQMP